MRGVRRHLYMSTSAKASSAFVPIQINRIRVIGGIIPTDVQTQQKKGTSLLMTPARSRFVAIAAPPSAAMNSSSHTKQIVSIIFNSPWVVFYSLVYPNETCLIVNNLLYEPTFYGEDRLNKGENRV